MLSLPVWECGLKYRDQPENSLLSHVTPCVGVWIEMVVLWVFVDTQLVTPCVGVWIEIRAVALCAVNRPRHSLCGSVD